MRDFFPLFPLVPFWANSRTVFKHNLDIVSPEASLPSLSLDTYHLPQRLSHHITLYSKDSFSGPLSYLVSTRSHSPLFLNA